MDIQLMISFLLGVTFTVLVIATPTIVYAFKKPKKRPAADGKKYELELNGSWSDDDWDQPIVEESRGSKRRKYQKAYYHANREKILAQQKNAQYTAKSAAESNLGASATEKSRKEAILASRRKRYQENKESILKRKRANREAKSISSGKVKRSYEKRDIGISAVKDPNGYAAAHNKIYTRPAKRSSLVPPVTLPLITPSGYTYGTRALS